MSSARDHARSITTPRGSQQPANALPSYAATVQCDACLSPMTIPPECVQAGVILGLLICTQCIEDDLSCRDFTHQLEASL